MHVCFISNKFGRDDALIVHRQGKSLIEDGHRVSLILCDGRPNEYKEGVEIVSISSMAIGIKDRLFRNPKLFKQFLKGYAADIYQISEPELLPLALFLKRKGEKVVFNLREYYPDYYSRKFSFILFSKVVNKIVKLYFHYIATKIDAVFNCMPEMSLRIKKEMPSKFFVDVANFPIVNKSYKLSLKDYTSRENIINYFGSIYEISCQEEFIEAISSIPNIKYLLAGVFCSRKYQDKIMSLPGWSNVEFINGFKRSELSSIISRSVIGNVIKDFHKTETPNGSMSIIKIYETMEAAIPVILAKVPMYVDMVEKYNCGICVNPHNVQEIHDAIQYLINNKEIAYQMGQNGRRAVIEEYNWDSQAQSYLSVLKSLYVSNQSDV